MMDFCVFVNEDIALKHNKNHTKSVLIVFGFGENEKK